MSFFDAADLPRVSIFRDSSRRYQGLSYNCDHNLQTPVSRALPPRRDSAIATSLHLATTTVTSPLSTRKPTPTMTFTLSPFVEADIPPAIAAHATATADESLQRTTSAHLSDSEKNDYRLQEWTLALQNPFARIVKATERGTLIGAAGFLTHKVCGLQWTAPSRKEETGSIEKEIDDRLAQSRDELLQGDYDIWHIYLVFLAPSHEHASVWRDMISWGLSQADEAGKRVYVQASSADKATYEELGFQVKKAVRLPVDTARRESAGECVRYLMLRPTKV
ncbi:uncharacterized protein EKO05_0008217 [Ascochyta rabiei]|uniref:N-acetyltransferase n=1 Tax=Didymella rabiei TaxID=5454 RepID=A0A163DC22_DIDRA|nr:uncharacterized protein EKO05_0008217 [Ascochyta rabiei]KZM23061.1 N-acetyltransferase [Ascochyta rabiei]UPX17890.1 hypothetical protein EKO05_0008217 [Ascochyta rabiei]